MTESFYRPDGTGGFLPSPHTVGPWDPESQHGGPPAALLTRALETCLAGSGLRLARLTVEILNPLPLRPLRVRAWVERPGRRIRLLRGTIAHGDRTLMAAGAWALAPAPADVPVPADDGEPLPPPERATGRDPTRLPRWNCGFLAATEWRFVRGGFGGTGPATVWIRPRIPLLPGEPMSPAQRVVLTADSANGVSAELDIDRWLFIPPELTVHLTREPAGEWLCLDAVSRLAPGGAGLATATLSDLRGPVARSAQAMLVAPR